MTSYRVVAPLFIGRFQGPEGVTFHGWSPRRYGPTYTYDLIIEGEDDQHPAMNQEYTDFVRRALDKISKEEEKEEGGKALVDTTTDFHCPVPPEERGEEAFLLTFRDGPFSPVFFVREDAILYRDHLLQELGASHDIMIRAFPHGWV